VTEGLTPLTAAASGDHYEIVQLLLKHGYTVDRPHKALCECTECVRVEKTQEVTSLNHSSRKRMKHGKKIVKSHVFFGFLKNVNNVEVVKGLKTTVTTVNQFCCFSQNYQSHYILIKDDQFQYSVVCRPYNMT